MPVSGNNEILALFDSPENAEDVLYIRIFPLISRQINATYLKYNTTHGISLHSFFLGRKLVEFQKLRFILTASINELFYIYFAA
jgi:hypothetical protein